MTLAELLKAAELIARVSRLLDNLEADAMAVLADGGDDFRALAELAAQHADIQMLKHGPDPLEGPAADVLPVIQSGLDNLADAIADALTEETLDGVAGVISRVQAIAKAASQDLPPSDSG